MHLHRYLSFEYAMKLKLFIICLTLSLFTSHLSLAQARGCLTIGGGISTLYTGNTNIRENHAVGNNLELFSLTPATNLTTCGITPTITGTACLVNFGGSARATGFIATANITPCPIDTGVWLLMGGTIVLFLAARSRFVFN